MKTHPPYLQQSSLISVRCRCAWRGRYSTFPVRTLAFPADIWLNLSWTISMLTDKVRRHMPSLTCSTKQLLLLCVNSRQLVGWPYVRCHILPYSSMRQRERDEFRWCMSWWKCFSYPFPVLVFEHFRTPEFFFHSKPYRAKQQARAAASWLRKAP